MPKTRRVFLENKQEIGMIDEVLGPVNNFVRFFVLIAYDSYSPSSSRKEFWLNPSKKAKESIWNLKTCLISTSSQTKERCPLRDLEESIEEEVSIFF